MKSFAVLALAIGVSLSVPKFNTVTGSEIPAASWATLLSGTREGILAPGILPNPAGGFYLYSTGDRPLIKFNVDGSIAWEVRQEPGVNDVREVAQMDILDNGDLIAIVGANLNARVFGQSFAASGRYLVELRSTDATPLFVKDLGNCWLTAVKARPGGGYFVGGYNFDVPRIGSDVLPIGTNRVFLAQFTTGFDWAATGDWNSFSDSIRFIRTIGSGANLRIWAVGDASSQPTKFGDRTLFQAGVCLATLDSKGGVVDFRIEVPNATMSAFELRPGGGAHLGVAASAGTNDLWRLDPNGVPVSRTEVPGQIAAIAASDEPYIVGSVGETPFTAAFDSLGNSKWIKNDVTRSLYTESGAAILADGRLAICGVTEPSGIFIDDFFLRDFSQIENTYYGAFVATLEVEAAARPVFRVQPRDQKLALRGENVTLHAQIFSPTTVTLRWYKNGHIIPGQNAADLVLPNAQAADSGAYFLEAQNANGVTRSVTVNVTVNSVAVSTLPGTDVPGAFDSPRSPIVLPEGSILVADPTKNLIKRVSAGSVTIFAGTGETGILNGGPLEAKFSAPSGLALEFRYNGSIVYVADSGNSLMRRIRLSAATSDPLSVDSISYDFPALANVATLDGLPFVIGASSTSTNVWRYNEGSIFFREGSVDSGSVGGLALDDRGNLYLADTTLNEIRRTTPENQVELFAAGLTAPAGIALDESGNLYVAERGSHTIRKVSPSGSKTIVAGLGARGFQNGSSSQALFNAPEGICFRAGSLIIADTGNHCLREIKFTPLNAANPGDAQLQFSLGNTLSLSVSGGGSVSFVIESTSQIGPNAQWQNEGTVSANAGQSLSLARPNGARFYRARQSP